MVELTPKENLLRTLRGEIPQSIPLYDYAKMDERDPFMVLGEPGCLNDYRGFNGGFDPFGVEYVTNEETGFAAIPKPGQYILKDITRWRDVIKRPDYSGVDWETMAKKDIEALGIDRDKTALCMLSVNEYFQPLMGMMGFTEGLCAMYEEPEEVYELMDMMCDVSEELTKNVLKYYKPDIWNFGDDSATKLNPFISYDMFKELLLPHYKRICDIVRDAGVLIDYHNCGRCEDFIPDMVEVCGINMWNPAQTSNDLIGIKERYKGRLTIAGGFDLEVPGKMEDVTEDEVRNAVRSTIDRLAYDGGYAFCGGVVGKWGDPVIGNINKWILDEALTYGKNYYEK